MPWIDVVNFILLLQGPPHYSYRERASHWQLLKLEVDIQSGSGFRNVARLSRGQWAPLAAGVLILAVRVMFLATLRGDQNRLPMRTTQGPATIKRRANGRAIQFEH